MRPPTPAPPVNRLAGTVAVAGGDTVSGLGTLRVALADSSGILTSSVDVDLSGCATVDDVVTQLNALGAGFTASISDGTLVLSADSSSGGIAVATLSGTDVATRFGLGDVLTYDSSQPAASIALRASIQSNAAALPVGAIATSGSLTVGDSAVAASSGTVASAMTQAMSASTSFAAAGGLGATRSTFASYAAAIISGAATTATTTASKATTAETTLETLTSQFSAQSGVNTDEEAATLVTLQNNYAASAKVISTVQSMFDALMSAVQS